MTLGSVPSVVPRKEGMQMKNTILTINDYWSFDINNIGISFLNQIFATDERPFYAIIDIQSKLV